VARLVPNTAAMLPPKPNSHSSRTPASKEPSGPYPTLEWWRCSRLRYLLSPAAGSQYPLAQSRACQHRDRDRCHDVPLKTQRSFQWWAELPTCQKMLAATRSARQDDLAPRSSRECRSDLEDPHGFALPWASSVRSPEEIASEDVDF